MELTVSASGGQAETLAGGDARCEQVREPPAHSRVLGGSASRLARGLYFLSPGLNPGTHCFWCSAFLSNSQSGIYIPNITIFKDSFFLVAWYRFCDTELQDLTEDPSLLSVFLISVPRADKLLPSWTADLSFGSWRRYSNVAFSPSATLTLNKHLPCRPKIGKSSPKGWIKTF